MLEFLETAPDVIALHIGGRIESGELDAIMDRLEPMLERDGQTHVFVETETITGIAIDGLARYSRRAMPLFHKLHKFGRVAVVADQMWIRAATRIESALLPHISYRTFTPGRRDEALAWVKGVGAT
jgi:SpoIIAA-like